jgi:hypothetical protein
MTITKRTLWLIIPWAVFVALAIAWIIYWHVLAGGAESRVRAWMAEQNQQGAQVSIGRIVRHGFPVLLRLELQDVAYVAARGGWRMNTARTDLHVQVINPNHIMFEAKAPIALTRENGDVTNISADALIASVRTEHGALAQAGIEADNLLLDDPAKEGVLHAHKIVLNVRPDPRAAGEYQLAFDGTTLILPRPVRSFEAFGLDVQALRAAIVVEDAAALLQTSPEDPFAPWREAGGRLRFEMLALQWGPLQATGTGWGGVDDQRRLIGALSFPIEHPAPVLAALANGPSVDEDARRALGLLAASFLISGDDITLDVEAADGVMKLEGFPVRTLPVVY